LPIEAVVRGYLSGSAWNEYREQSARQANAGATTIDLWGVSLPTGLRESDRLPAPVFTPSTKATRATTCPSGAKTFPICSAAMARWPDPLPAMPLTCTNGPRNRRARAA
jgi:phosphoribosylaminoimidazole-succinocarboxamide synthase